MDSRHPPLRAFLWGAPIGLLGGLIGLGGGEFRLPVLVERFGFTPRAAVPTNLLISLLTLVASLIIRAGTLSLAPVRPFAFEVTALAAGAVVAAAASAKLLTRLSDHRLGRIIALLLAGIAGVLIAESALPEGLPALAPADFGLRLCLAVLLGLLIGTVSTLLGVAGGELLIPTLTLVFGADIHTAGTASLMVSTLSVAMGLWRYYRLGAFRQHSHLLTTAVPMGGGSVLGAAVGGVLTGMVSASALKVTLAAILVVAAVRLFRHSHQTTAKPNPDL